MKTYKDYVLNDGDLLEFGDLKAMLHLLNKKVAVVIFLPE